MNKTYLGDLVPVGHGVDSFTELRAAGLVYATGIDPGISKRVFMSQATRLLDLVPALLEFRTSKVGHIVEKNLLVLAVPSVR